MAQDALESMCEQMVRTKKKRIAQVVLSGWEARRPTDVPKNFVDFYCLVARKMGYSGESGEVTFPVYLLRMMELIIHSRITLPSALKCEQERIVLLQSVNNLEEEIVPTDCERDCNGKKAVIDIAPRHLKTSSTLIALLWVCVWKANTKSLYASYSDEIIRLASNQFASMAESIGFNSLEMGTVSERKVNSNLVFFKSVRGPITAIGVNWTSVVDDSLKGINDARSTIIRDQVWETIQTCVFTRFELNRVNSLIVGTRWHADDSQGRALKLGYSHISIPALMKDESGDECALAPDLRSKEFLLDRKKELGDDFFDVLYQGKPASDKMGLFMNNVKYENDGGWSADGKIFTTEISPNDRVVSEAHGIDVSYAATRKSDYSCWVHLTKLQSGKVVLKKMRLSRGETLRRFFIECKKEGMPSDKLLHWYTGGQETHLTEEIGQAHGVRIKAHPSLGKLGNAQNFAKVWNNGQFYLPAAWKDAEITSKEVTAINQIVGFSGADENNEDAVDAIAAAIDQIVPRTETGSVPSVDFRMFHIRKNAR
jgi:hypothetical protein